MGGGTGMPMAPIGMGIRPSRGGDGTNSGDGWTGSRTGGAGGFSTVAMVWLARGGLSGGLALLKRTEIEQREVAALVKQRFPRLGSGRAATYGGSGTRAGVAAGNSTSVNRQMTRRSAPALTGY